MELISIIVPVYNAGKFIGETIESVLAQTYEHWELLLVDDGSTDNSRSQIEKYTGDSRIRYFYKENGGQGSARNVGVKHAKAELIAFLDADDLWKPEKLEVQLDIFKQKNCDLVFSYADVIDAESNRTGKRKNPETGFFKGPEAFIGLVNGTFFMPQLTVMTKKSLIQEVGGFNETRSIQNAEDFDLWARLFLNGAKAYGTDQSLAYYRSHDEQSTASDNTATFRLVSSLLSIRDSYQEYYQDINYGIIWRLRRFSKQNQVNPQKINKIKSTLLSIFPDRFYKLNEFLCKLIGIKIYTKLLLIIIDWKRRHRD